MKNWGVKSVSVGVLANLKTAWATRDVTDVQPLADHSFHSLTQRLDTVKLEIKKHDGPLGTIGAMASEDGLQKPEKDTRDRN